MVDRPEPIGRLAVITASPQVSRIDVRMMQQNMGNGRNITSDWPAGSRAPDLTNYCEQILRKMDWYASPCSPRTTSRTRSVNKLVYAGVSPGQGVTTLAVTTAVVASRDPLSRILLLDGSDEQAVQEHLPCGKSRCDLEIALAKFIRSSPIKNLFVLSLVDLGGIRHTARLKTAWQQLASCFDLIVVDFPTGSARRWQEMLLTNSNLIVVATPRCPRHLVQQRAQQLCANGVFRAGMVVNMDETRPRTSAS